VVPKPAVGLSLKEKAGDFIAKPLDLHKFVAEYKNVNP
jgi:hypothetical protein